MQIKETLNKDLARNFEVIVSPNDISIITDKKADELAKEVDLKGFRKGKVPANVVKNLYKDSLNKEVVDHLINEAAHKIITENKLKLASQPKIEVTKFDTKSGLEAKFEMELYPEVPTIDVKKIKLPDYTYKIEKTEYEEAENRLLSMHKELTEAKPNTKAKKGDTVLIDFTGFIDGEKFPGGEAKDYKLDLGSGNFIPGFEDGLIGCKEGDKHKLQLTFPKDYGSKKHAGKKVEFEVDVKKVYHQNLPKLDDEFAKKLHLKDAKELKSKIEESLAENYQNIKRSVTKKELFDELEKLAKFKLPTQMVEREFKGLMAQTKNSKETKELDEKELKDLEKTYKKIAERRVKLGILLAEIAKQENIKVENQDINNLVIQQARQMPGQEQAIVDYYKNNPNALEGLKGQILEDKSVDHLINILEKQEQKITTKKLVELSKKID